MRQDFGKMEFKKAPVQTKKVSSTDESLADMLVIGSGQQKKKKRKVMWGKGGRETEINYIYYLIFTLLNLNEY